MKPDVQERPCVRRRALGGPLQRALAAVTAVMLLNAPSVHGAGTSYAPLIRQVAPSVVTVLVEQQRESAGQRAADRATAGLDPDRMRAIMRRWLSGPGDAPGPDDGGKVLGSGFIIRSDGLIVTNRHVIVGARTVRVKLADGRDLPAQVVGADAATDLALLRIHADRLPVLRLGSTDKVAVGDPVVAIGNPFGLGQSVTAGIVSARGRTLENDAYIDFLQTDAAINLGNSGGPLLSADGLVVGVTSAILSPSGGSIGLGFAIPAETVASVVGELESHGRVDRGYLGIEVQAMTPALATALGLDTPMGALVTAVASHGPAAGTIWVGDVLLSVGPTPVTFIGLGKITARMTPGATVDALVMRNGAQQSLSLTIGHLPDPPDNPAFVGGPDTWVPNLELAVAGTTPEIRKTIKAEAESGGLIVTQLRPVGSGAQAGLKIGDLITHAGSKHLAEIDDLASVGTPSTRLPLLLRVVREGSARFIAVTGSEDP